MKNMHFYCLPALPNGAEQTIGEVRKNNFLLLCCDNKSNLTCYAATQATRLISDKAGEPKLNGYEIPTAVPVAASISFLAILHGTQTH